MVPAKASGNGVANDDCKTCFVPHCFLLFTPSFAPLFSFGILIGSNNTESSSNVIRLCPSARLLVFKTAMLQKTFVDQELGLNVRSLCSFSIYYFNYSISTRSPSR